MMVVATTAKKIVQASCTRALDAMDTPDMVNSRAQTAARDYTLQQIRNLTMNQSKLTVLVTTTFYNVRKESTQERLRRQTWYIEQFRQLAAAGFNVLWRPHPLHHLSNADRNGRGYSIVDGVHFPVLSALVEMVDVVVSEGGGGANVFLRKPFVLVTLDKADADYVERTCSSCGTLGPHNAVVASRYSSTQGTIQPRDLVTAVSEALGRGTLSYRELTELNDGRMGLERYRTVCMDGFEDMRMWFMLFKQLPCVNPLPCLDTGGTDSETQKVLAAIKATRCKRVTCQVLMANIKLLIGHYIAAGATCGPFWIYSDLARQQRQMISENSIP